MIPRLSMLIFPSYWYVKLAKVPYPLTAWACSDTTSWTSQAWGLPLPRPWSVRLPPPFGARVFFFLALILRQPGRFAPSLPNDPRPFDPFRESSGVLAGSWVSSVTSAFILDMRPAIEPVRGWQVWLGISVGWPSWPPQSPETLHGARFNSAFEWWEP